MGRRVLGRLLIVTAVAIAVVTAWLLVVVWRSPDRDGLEAFGTLALPVGAIAAGVTGRAWRAGTRRPGGKVAVPELDQLADLLAGAVRDQWTRAAAERGLLEPEPIPVRWARPSLPLAGPVSAAVGSQRFPPLPGLPVAGPQRLRAGRVRDLHAVYGGLGSGRLVIAGPAGSGKSGAAVLLVLAALNYRALLPAADRPLVPVPVLFTLHEWDPREQPVGDWLAAKLRQTYPSFAGRPGAAAAAALLAAGKIAVILDGLDEMPQELRPIALRSLSQQATFRLVLLTRSAEMAAAAASGLLEGAAAIELQGVAPSAAADYLTRIQVDPAPRGWAELTGRLRRDPDSSLARALSNPLALTLIRDTYRGADDVGELLEFCDAADGAAAPDDIMDLLLDRVLPAAYAPRPGERPPPFDLRAARQTLRYIAVRMNQDGTRDLQWWRLAAWAPAAPRRVLTGLIGVLVIGPLVGLAVGLTTRPAIEGLWWGLGIGVMMGFTAAPSGGPSSRAGGGDPQRISRPRWRHVLRSPGLAVGGTTGFAFGITWATSSGHRVSPVAGIALGSVVGLALGLPFALAEDIAKPRADHASPLSPLTSWRSDRAHGLTAALAFGLAYGVMVGLMTGTPDGFGNGGLWTGVAAGLAAAVGTVLGGAFILPRTWPASLAFAQLAARGHTPVHLMRFLEDARDRNVLRTIGPAYQFRHARLQDRLAEPDLVSMSRREQRSLPMTGPRAMIPSRVGRPS